MERQVTGIRVQLEVAEQKHTADCSLFLESYGPPARWHGRVWAIQPATGFKKGTQGILTLPQGSTGQIVIQRVGVRGAYDFQGEGLPPTF